jgi:hypothetical protein
MRVSHIIYLMDVHLAAITHREVTPAIAVLFHITKPTMPRAYRLLPRDEHLFRKSFDYRIGRWGSDEERI